MIAGLSFDESRLASAIDPSLHAAERADRLVKDEHLTFRDAHRRAREQDA